MEKKTKNTTNKFILKSWIQESGFKYLDGLLWRTKKTIDKTGYNLSGAFIT